MYASRLLAALAVLPMLAAAQDTQEHAFHFTTPTTEQASQDMRTALMTISDMRMIAMDDAAHTVRVRGTEEQMKLGEWIVSQLDKPVTPNFSGASPVYRMKDGDEPVARIYYLTAGTAQDRNETATVLRTITDVRRIFIVQEGAIAVRGTQEQIDAADWLMAAIDKPALAGEHLFSQTPRPREDDRFIRVFSYPTGSVQDLNEVGTMLRTITDTRRLFMLSGKHLIFQRGTKEQAAMSEWLMKQLTQELPKKTAQMSEDQAAPGKEVIRVFYLPASTPTKTMNETMTSVLKTAGIRRVFGYSNARVVAVRATPAQMAAAVPLIQQ